MFITKCYVMHDKQNCADCYFKIIIPYLKHLTHFIFDSSVFVSGGGRGNGEHMSIIRIFKYSKHINIKRNCTVISSGKIIWFVLLLPANIPNLTLHFSPGPLSFAKAEMSWAPFIHNHIRSCSWIWGQSRIPWTRQRKVNRSHSVRLMHLCVQVSTDWEDGTI